MIDELGPKQSLDVTKAVKPPSVILTKPLTEKLLAIKDLSHTSEAHGTRVHGYTIHYLLHTHTRADV